MDPIKEAFQKAKQDISDLRTQIIDLSNQISELRSLISLSFQNSSQQNPQQIIRQTNQQTDTELPIIIDNFPTFQQTQTSENNTLQQINPTDKLSEPYKQHLYGSKSQNLVISTGNEGVPTNRQTNQQTDRQTNSLKEFSYNQFKTKGNVRLIQLSDTLRDLDSLKQELKHQFKLLTNQEFVVFSTIYQLENEGFVVDYPLVASKLSLSESSIRDYSLKIIKKGIPLLKNKLQNKKVILSISPDLKKIAPLTAILSLKSL